jgi:hypothetical protein
MSGDMSMNELTQKLLDAGYTKEEYPEFVTWSHWNDFEYVYKFLQKMVLETPCGLLQMGIGNYNHGSHMGVDYCPENDNPRYGCPYYDEVSCPHRFETNLWGWNCAYHFSNKPYDYEMSVEKIWNQWDEIQYKSRMEATEGAYCACMKWDRYNRRYKPEYDVDECIQARCGNEVCVITKRNRNLEKVNIFYDIIRTYKIKNGFLEITERKLEKGVKQFDHPVARTDAEMWLKTRNGKEFNPKLTRDDRRNLYFVEYHGRDDFTVEVQNIRIEKRESRDLLQDLRDAQEGFEVTHASDNEKKKKQDKHERRVKYQDDKKRRMDKKNVEKWKRLIMDDDFAKQYSKENGISIKSLRDLSESELKKRGIILQETKQLSMF